MSGSLSLRVDNRQDSPQKGAGAGKTDLSPKPKAKGKAKAKAKGKAKSKAAPSRPSKSSWEKDSTGSESESVPEKPADDDKGVWDCNMSQCVSPSFHSRTISFCCCQGPGPKTAAAKPKPAKNAPAACLQDVTCSIHQVYTRIALHKACFESVVDAKDFSRSAYVVVMNRCQQVALEHAKMSVPDPSKQIELIKLRRQRGKRGGAATLGLTLFLSVYSCSKLLLDCTYDPMCNS